MSRVMRLERQLAEAIDHIQAATPHTNQPTTIQQATPTSNSATAPSSSTVATVGENEEVQTLVLSAPLTVYSGTHVVRPAGSGTGGGEGSGRGQAEGNRSSESTDCAT